MKVVIETDYETELEDKKADIVKAITGERYSVDLEKSYKRRPFRLKANKEMFDFWDVRFKKMVAELKKEIGDILG